MNLAARLSTAIVDVPDFPKPGIVYKDITPVFLDPDLSNAILNELVLMYTGKGIDAIAGLESRGFLMGMPLALRLGVPFIMMRKKNKLPRERHSVQYDLEYGTETIEMHKDAIRPGQKILIHDDVLATGGTALAASKLVSLSRGEIAGFSFLVELTFLGGRKNLAQISEQISTFAGF
ncbi:MAG: adenine phosphoribosyltransferase [Flavobacteriales bacterium]